MNHNKPPAVVHVRQDHSMPDPAVALAARGNDNGGGTLGYYQHPRGNNINNPHDLDNSSPACDDSDDGIIVLKVVKASESGPPKPHTHRRQRRPQSMLPPTPVSSSAQQVPAVAAAAAAPGSRLKASSIPMVRRVATDNAANRNNSTGGPAAASATATTARRSSPTTRPVGFDKAMDPRPPAQLKDPHPPPLQQQPTAHPASLPARPEPHLQRQQQVTDKEGIEIDTNYITATSSLSGGSTSVGGEATGVGTTATTTVAAIKDGESSSNSENSASNRNTSKILQSMPRIVNSPYEGNASAEVGETEFEQVKAYLTKKSDASIRALGETIANAAPVATKEIELSGELFQRAWHSVGKIGNASLGFLSKPIVLLLLFESRIMEAEDDALATIIKDLGVGKFLLKALEKYQLQTKYPRLVYAAFKGLTITFEKSKTECMKCAIFAARAYHCVLNLNKLHGTMSHSLLVKFKRCCEIMNKNIKVNDKEAKRYQADLKEILAEAPPCLPPLLFRSPPTKRSRESSKKRKKSTAGVNSTPPLSSSEQPTLPKKKRGRSPIATTHSSKSDGDESYESMLLQMRNLRKEMSEMKDDFESKHKHIRQQYLEKAEKLTNQFDEQYNILEGKLDSMEQKVKAQAEKKRAKAETELGGQK